MIKNTIRRILRENTKDKVMNLIDNYGIVAASQFVGGYDEVKKLIGEHEISREQKIDFINDFISKNDDGVSLFNFGGPIPYFETNDGYHQIEYLSPNRVIINVYGGREGDIDMGEYGIPYDRLNNKILEDIFEILVNASI